MKLLFVLILLLFIGCVSTQTKHDCDEKPPHVRLI